MGYHWDDFLEHSGVKGQKWGIRNFQNKDGSNTALGLARRRKGYSGKSSSATLNKLKSKKADLVEKKAQNKAARKESKEILKENKKASKKNIKSMSDEELKKGIDRMKLEEDYKDHLMKNRTAGQKFAAEMGNTMKKVAVDSVSYTMKKASEKAIDKAIGKMFEEEKTPMSDVLKTFDKNARKLSEKDAERVAKYYQNLGNAAANKYRSEHEGMAKHPDTKDKKDDDIERVSGDVVDTPKKTDYSTRADDTVDYSTSSSTALSTKRRKK